VAGPAELRQESGEEQDHLRVGEVREHGPSEELAALGFCRGQVAVSTGAQGGHREPPEISAAADLDDGQRPWCGAQHKSQPESRGADVHDHAERHADRGDQPGAGAAGQRHGGDVGVVRAWCHGDKDDRGQEAGQYRRVEHLSHLLVQCVTL
jgi:hypothetical protein